MISVRSAELAQMTHGPPAHLAVHVDLLHLVLGTHEHLEASVRAVRSVTAADTAQRRPGLILTFGLKLVVGPTYSCWALGVPQGWFILKHSLQKLALQSMQLLVAS